MPRASSAAAWRVTHGRQLRLPGVGLEPDDLSAEGVIGGVGGEQRAEGRHESPDISVAPREPTMVDQREARMGLPDRGVLGRQPNEVAHVLRHDHAAFRARYGPQRFVRRTMQVRTLDHGNDVVSLAAQLDCGLRGEMLIEQESHAKC